MKRIFSAALACLLILSGCAGASGRKTTYVVAGGLTNPAQRGPVTLAIPADADEILVRAAELFCQKAGELSKGGLVVSVEKSNSAEDDFKAGKVQAALLNGEKAAGLYSWFQILNEPFRYKSYEHFSMTCNAEAVLWELSKTSGSTVLAGYYTGSNVFLGYNSIASTQILEILSDNKDDGHVHIAAISGSGAARPLEQLGLSVVQIQDFSERAAMLTEREAIIEITFGELLSGGLSEQGLTVTRAYHSIIPLWLAVSNEFYAQLPPLEKAALLEAAACLTGAIDAEYLKSELDALDSVTRRFDYDVSEDFTSNRARILKALSKLRGDVSDEEKNFRAQLDAI